MILVTGATGCLGSNITRELVVRGESVAILRRAGDSLSAIEDVVKDVQHRSGDVCDFDSVKRALAGVHKVYHLAGVAVQRNALTSLMMRVNVGGTGNLARGALEAGVERLVHVSSAAAVGYPDRGVIADEQFAYNGDEIGHGYAESKHLGEQLVLDYVARGLAAVVVNPTAVMATGGDLDHSWAGLVLRIKRRKLRFYPGGGVGMTTRKDLVDGLIKAMDHGVVGERYILNTVNLSYEELTTTIAAVVGVPAPRLACPDWLLRTASYPVGLYAACIRNPLKTPFLVPENVPLLTRDMYYNQAKAIRQLGMSQSPLEDAVREVDDWCGARG